MIIRYSDNRYSRQSGVAAIMFVLMLPVLLGLMALGVDGAHFLRAKAHVGDAMDIAILAVSAKGSTKASENEALAKNYIKAQMPELSDEDIAVSVKYEMCDGKKQCKGKNGKDWSQNDSPFFEYSVNGAVTINSLFPLLGQKSIGFDPTLDMSASAVARKYHQPAVDIFIVADFSYSMGENTPGDTISKLERLKDIVGQAEDVVKKSDGAFKKKNTITLIPFNGTTRKSNAASCAVTQLIYKNPSKKSKVPKDYKILPKKTFKQLFVKKKCFYEEYEFKYSVDPNRPSLRLPQLEKHGLHGIVEHNSAANFLSNTIKNMTTGNGDTNSFEGIIRAAQFADDAKNSIRHIIILSDGADKAVRYFKILNEETGRVDSKVGYFKSTDVHKKLLDTFWPPNLTKKYKDSGFSPKGYCNLIKAKFSKLENIEIENYSLPVELKLSVIGFDYQEGNNTNLEACVGKENVYYANNMEQVNDELLNLIGEEAGTIYSQYESKKNDK